MRATKSETTQSTQCNVELNEERHRNEDNPNLGSYNNQKRNLVRDDDKL